MPENNDSSIERVEKYIEMMTKRVEKYEHAKEERPKIKDKINKFTDYYTSNINNPKEKEYTAALAYTYFIIYKTIITLGEKTLDDSINQWLTENADFIETIQSYESIAGEEQFTSQDTENFYIAGSDIPRINNPIGDSDDPYIFTDKQKKVIISTFRPDLFASAKEELTAVKEIIDSILLKRKIDSMDEVEIRSLYDDITNSSINKEIEELLATIKDLKIGYSNNELYDDTEWGTDPYYTGLSEKLAVLKTTKEQQSALIEQVPIQEIKEKLYDMLSGSKSDYEKKKKDNQSRKILEAQNFDFSQLDSEIAKTQNRLSLLGDERFKNINLSFKTMKEIYEINTRDYQTCDEYNEYIKRASSNLMLGLWKWQNFTTAYDDATKRIGLCDIDIEKNQQAISEYNQKNLIAKKLSKKERDDIEVTICALRDTKKLLEDRKNILKTEEKGIIDIIKLGLECFIKEYNTTLQEPKYFTIRQAINRVYNLGDNPLERCKFIKNILNSSDINKELETDINTLYNQTHFTQSSNKINSLIECSKIVAKERINSINELFAMAITDCPSLAERGLTIETITDEDINQERETQQGYYEILCSAKNATEEDKFADKAFEILAPNDTKIGDDVMMAKPKLYAKIRQYLGTE